jgi:hypothetical protein
MTALAVVLLIAALQLGKLHAQPYISDGTYEQECEFLGLSFQIESFLQGGSQKLDPPHLDSFI